MYRLYWLYCIGYTKIKIDGMDVLGRCLVGKSERLVGLVVLAHCISSWYFFVLCSLLALDLDPFRSSLPFGLRTSLLLLLLPRISPNGASWFSSRCLHERRGHFDCAR